MNTSVVELDFQEVFNLRKLRTLIGEKFGVPLLVESDIYDHRIHLYHQIAKYTTINQTLPDLKNYLTTDNIVLDVGPLYLRMIDTNCSNQKEIATIFHTLIESLADPLNDLIVSLKSHLPDNYNAVHLPIEPESFSRRPEGEYVAKSWENILSSTQKFSTSVPLYVACGNCQINSKFKYIITKHTYAKELSPTLKKFYHKFMSSVDIMALVDLKILIGANKFAGSSFSAFSHAVVSERLFLDKWSTNICIFRLTPASFTSDFQTYFGRTTPDVTCSHLHHIQTNLDAAVLREIINSIPEIFEMMNVENSPFNSLVYMLSYQIPSYSLPLVYTYLNIPFGDKWQLYNKVQQLFDKPGKRSLIMCALETALGAPISRPVRILMVLHNTMMQGAPLMAFYLAKLYKERLGIEINFFVPAEGRGKLEVLIRNNGMKIQVGKRLTSVNMMRYNAVYLNTIVSWYHEYFPKYIGLYRKMCILYVHESMRTEIFKLYPSAEEVLKSAKELIFVTARSQSVYQDILDQRPNGNYFVVGNSLSPRMILSSQTNSEANGIRTQLGINPSDLLFVISGDVYPNRNQAVFVEASILLLDYLNQSYYSSPSSSSSTSSSSLKLHSPKEVFFLIIGFTELTQYVIDIYQRIKESPYHNQFIVRDKMPHQQSLEFMAAGDVYVSLALKESFGLALLEAMTMGIPIIVAKLDGVPDVIYPEALDVNPTSPVSVYESMKVLLSPATRTLHSSFSQNRSQYFQQQFFLIRHLDVLRRVLWLPNG